MDTGDPYESFNKRDVSIVYYKGTIRDLGGLIRILVEKHGLRALGYKLEDTSIKWSAINSIEDLPLGVEDVVSPGSLRLVRGGRFRHSFQSPKYTLYPPEQLLGAEPRDFSFYETPLGDKHGFALFGIKTCDLEAILILDSALYGKHPVYTRMRDLVKAIVVEECVEPNDNCFCSVLGKGPVATRGFDIAYVRVDDDNVFFKPGSSLGESVLAEMRLEEISGESSRVVKRLFANAVDKMNRRTGFRTSELDELIKIARVDELWEKISDRCIGCGNCNLVCPTCFCIELDIVVDGDKAWKTARWTGCLLYSYGLVAGGHFRPRIHMRYRHFVLHKFVFYKRQIGTIGCVGCGRCITWCPIGLDIRQALRTALSQSGLNE